MADVGVPRVVDRDDAVALDADRAFEDPEHRVDHQRSDEDGVELAPTDPPTVDHHPVADVLRPSRDHLVAVDRVVVLDLDDQRGVAETHPVPGGRSVDEGVLLAGDLTGHGSGLAVVDGRRHQLETVDVAVAGAFGVLSGDRIGQHDDAGAVVEHRLAHQPRARTATPGRTSAVVSTCCPYSLTPA